MPARFGRQTLAAGQVMFAHGDASHPLQLTDARQAVQDHARTEMVASYASIVVRKDLYDAGITTVEKLAAYKRPDGAKPIVAATAIGSGTWMFGTYVFESRGLGDKVNWVAGGGPSTMFPSLETKQFDAIMAPPELGGRDREQRVWQGHLRHRQPGVFDEAISAAPCRCSSSTRCRRRSIRTTRPCRRFVNAMYRGDAVGEGGAARRGLRAWSATNTSPASTRSR